MIEIFLTLWYGQSNYGPETTPQNQVTLTDIHNTVRTCQLSAIHSNYIRTRYFSSACVVTKVVISLIPFTAALSYLATTIVTVLQYCLCISKCLH